MPGPSIKITIDDSKLRELIRDTRGKSPVRIVADGVEYGLFVEMGTTRMAARPCAKPAVEALRAGFPAKMKGAITMEQVEERIELTAREVEELWKRNITTQKAVDTGAYRSSVHVVASDNLEFEVPQR